MLHFIDYLLVAIFLLATAVLGISSRGRQVKTDDYFISRSSLTGVFGSGVIGLSLTATFFSGITFLAYPSVVLNHGLVIFAGVATFLIQYFIVVYFFIPRFTRKSWSAPYAILEERFGAPTRKVASVLYILMRLGWMAALIYAPATAILGAVGIGLQYFWPVVLFVGLTSTVYSAFGGLRSIMITDALQMLVILVGLLITISFIFYFLPVPFGEAWARLGETGRLKLFDFSLDSSLPITTWSAIFGTFFATVGMYMGDQMSLQRYMTAESRESIRRSFLINVSGVIGILLMLGAIGLSLAAWFEFKPSEALPRNSDQIFPFFVASEMPIGIAGLILAALLGATMSSMTSGINALSGAIQMDLVPGLLEGKTDRKKITVARLLSFGIGLAATLSTALVAQLGQIFDIAQKLLGVFLGPLAICLIFAVLSVRILRGFVIGGLLGGCGFGILVALSPQLNGLFPAIPIVGSLWTAPTAMFAAMAIMILGIRESPSVESPGSSCQATLTRS